MCCCCFFITKMSLFFIRFFGQKFFISSVIFPWSVIYLLFPEQCLLKTLGCSYGLPIVCPDLLKKLFFLHGITFATLLFFLRII